MTSSRQKSKIIVMRQLCIWNTQHVTLYEKKYTLVKMFHFRSINRDTARQQNYFMKYRIEKKPVMDRC
jgi:hypothetical protein